MFHSANPNSDAFWYSTFDEVLLVIKGKVDDWRISRQLSYNIYCSWAKEPISIFDYCPLPYDDELIQQDQQQTDEAYYNWASQEMRNFKWPEKASKN